MEATTAGDHLAMPRRTMFHGADERWMRGPIGTIIGCACSAAEAASA